MAGADPRTGGAPGGATLRSRLAVVRRRLRHLLRPQPALRLLEVPLADLRCQVTAFGERQGFSGRPIEHFPPHGFFVTHLCDPRRAEADFAAWYRLWFGERQGWRVAKRRGGMRGGSLDRAVRRLFEERHGRPPVSTAEADAGLVEEAILLRVRYYLGLFESIRARGLDPRSPLPCGLGRGVYFLRDGHHRASALHALGAERVPILVPEAR